MSQNLSELANQISQLPAQERAQLAMLLLASLETADTGDMDEIWRIEAESRLAEIERGEARLTPAQDVFDNLRRRLP